MTWVRVPVAEFTVIGTPGAEPRASTTVRQSGARCPKCKMGRPVLKPACGLCGRRPFAMETYVRAKRAGTSRSWKTLLQLTSRRFRPREPLSGPVYVSMAFFLKRPAKPDRDRKRTDPDDPSGAFPHDSKPDRDNLDKAVLDAMTNDRWFADDAKVAAGEISKWYAGMGESTGARITVDVMLPASRFSEVPETAIIVPVPEPLADVGQSFPMAVG